MVRLALLGLSALLLASSAEAAWLRLDTPNFVVIGDSDPRKLRAIAIEFERFRETLSRVLTARVTESAVPTIVFVFTSDRQFTPFKQLYQGKPVRSAGYFHGDRDFNYITVLADGRPGGRRVIFHEYAHLVASNIAANLPAWLNEGLAEYYSTFEVTNGGREATIGHPVVGHLRLLSRRPPLFSLEELFQIDHDSPHYNEGERRSVFYAQSWALTHMLMQPERAAALAAFIRHKQDGVPDANAWRQAFGDAPVQNELAVYSRRFTFETSKHKFPEALGSFEGTSAFLSEADVYAMLAGLHVRQRRYAEAEVLIADALRRDARHPHANVLKAHIESERGDHAAAAARLLRLDGVSDWFVAYTAGVTLSSAIDATRDPADDRLAAARAYFETVRRARGDMPHVLAQLVSLDLMSRDGPSASSEATIERARELAPGRHDYALIHARVLAEMGAAASARKILERLAGPGFPPHIRETAKNWMATIANAERTLAGGRRRMFYRARGPGEERLEGTLERIDCPAEAPAMFRVRAGTAVQTLFAPRLHEIELITYRRDVTRQMICGPWQTPAPVYVTWKHGAEGLKVVVAVEFLPLNPR